MRASSLFTACCLAAAAAAPLRAEVVTREIHLQPSDLVIEPGAEYQNFLLQGGSTFFEEGEPDLPVLPVFVSIPANSRVVGVAVVPLEVRELPGVHTPRPVLPPRPDGAAPTPFADGFLERDSWFPEDPAVVSRTGRMRGRTLAGIGVAPVQWHPDRGAVRFFTRFRVEVTTEPAGPEAGALRVLRESPAGRQSFAAAYRQLTGTGAGTGILESAENFAPLINSGEPFAPTFRPSVDGSPVEMVIITTSAQEAEYQRLADYRTQTGLSTVVRNLDWIKANYPRGVDTHETIRNFISDAVAKWGTAYVLLGGDTDDIPIRYGHTEFYGSENIPTDLYYTDLDGTWNADGDDIFGEARLSTVVPGDEVDLYPDVWVGRLPSDTVAEAEILVDKTLAYTQFPPVGYQTRYLALGEVLFPQNYQPPDDILYDGAEICEDAIGYTPAATWVRLYENAPGFPGSLLEDKPVVIDSINAGFSLVHHVGHGYINTMAVGVDGKSLNNSDADAFVNGARTFLLYAINCTSAAVDFNCIAERFMLNGNGGCFGVIGSTRLDFPTTGRSYQNNFYELVFTDGVTDLGRAMAEAKIPNVIFANQDNTHRWTQFTQIYLGDPSLHLYTAVPGTLDVSHASTFALGDDTFTVDVSYEGSPAESAKVTLFKDGDAYSLGYTDVLGQVVLPFRPDLTGTFSVGVKLFNAIPYVAEATVVAPVSAPYLFALDQNIDDDNVGLSTGNGDQLIDSGENIELGITVKNNGTATETSIIATLSTTDPHVTINDNLSFYPNIAAGNSAPPNDPFVIEVSRDAPNRHEVHCNLTINGASGSFNQEVILYVHAPVFEYYSQSVRDSVGNGNDNGVLSVNEDFAIIPTVRNLGLGQAVGIELRLRSGDPAVTITDSVSVIGDIDADQLGVNPADGFALRLSNLSDYHELRVVAIDAYGEVFNRLLDWVAPAAPSDVTAFGAATAIALTWSVVTDSTLFEHNQLWGYNVYRAPTESGPFTRVNDHTSRNHAYYNDEDLPGLTRFYYKIAAVDSSGNHGPFSPVTSATTSLPLAAGFPIETLTSTAAGVTIADIDGDGTLEILGGGEEIYAVEPDGSEYIDGDNDIRTLGPLSQTGLQGFWNTPAVGDLDGDGVNEVVGASWNDSRVYVYDADGVARPGWPKSVNPLAFTPLNSLGSVCLADLTADGNLEVIVSAGRAILAWRHDGTEVIDGDSNPSTDGVFALTDVEFSYGTPTVVNLDDEPYPELVAGMRDNKVYVFNHDGSLYPGWPFVTSQNITSSPSVADIDLDGQLEIVIGSSDAKVYALRADLTSAAGFPVGIQLNEDVDSSPGLGDLNGDGRLDVVIGASNGAVFAFSGANGAVLSGWPVLIRDNLNNQIPVRSSPVIVDVDGDGNLDVVVGDQIGRIHGLTGTGGLLPGFPIQTGGLIEGACAVWDVDDDGLTEVIAQSFDQNIYVFDTPWTFDESRAPWPMFKRNQRNNAVMAEPVFEKVGVGDSPVAPTAALFQNAPNPVSGAATHIRYRVPEGESYRRVTLMVFDLNGGLVRTLVDGEQPPGLHELRWDARDQTGRAVASGIYPYRLQVAGEHLTRKMVVLR